jgi:hypothetical protein
MGYGPSPVDGGCVHVEIDAPAHPGRENSLSVPAIGRDRQGPALGEAARPSLRRRRRCTVLATAVGVGLGLGCAHSGERPPEQPVAYNHKVHAEELSIPCDQCHTGVESRERAGFPPDDYCEQCHVAPMGDSPAQAKLVELLDAGTPLAWVQVTKIASYVLFSHRRHVALGNIDCTVCHGDMRERVRPITEPAVDFRGRSGMLRCMKCHVESGSPYAGVECVNCHR